MPVFRLMPKMKPILTLYEGGFEDLQVGEQPERPLVILLSSEPAFPSLVTMIPLWLSYQLLYDEPESGNKH